MKLTYRTLWISDLHLGTRGCRGAELARFLKRVRCQHLYLVGDVIDMTSLRQRWHWPAAHNEVVRRILKMAKRGTRVVYIPGNHDDAARQYLGMEFGGVRLMDRAIHETADGRKLLVIHGDQFDLVIRHSRLLWLLGAWAYERLLTINRVMNKVRDLLGRPHWSLSQYLKLKVKSACNFISRFENALAQEARRHRMQGVVCGHVHKPEVRTLEGDQLTYYNCGDWVESCTALAEHFDGELELIECLPLLAELDRAGTADAAPSTPAWRRPQPAGRDLVEIA